MIPLIVCPHDVQCMDANVKLLSTRHALQGSCMGLYPRYEQLTGDGRGAYFAATVGEGRIVGLSTVRIAESGRAYRVDGFAHARFAEMWAPLISAAVEWSAAHGADTARACCSVEDESKRAALCELGFTASGDGEPIDLPARRVSTVLLTKSLL